MLADRRFRRIRQAELDHAATFPVRQIVKPRQREKTIQGNSPDFTPRQRDRTGAANQFGAAAQQGHIGLLRRIVRQEPLLGDPALLDQLRQIRRRQALIRATQTAFGHMRQGQVDIVAAEHQMVADPDAGQFGFVPALLHFDQGQVGGAAADIANQQQMHIGQGLLDRPGMTP